MPPATRVQAASRLLSRGGGNAQFAEGMVKRVRKADVKISTSVASTQATHSAKTSQSWKYSGGQIDRASHLDKTKYFDHKDRNLGRRKQESNFFITINTNKQPDTEGICASAFEKTIKEIGDEIVISRYIKFGPVNDEYMDDKYTDVIISRDWKAAKIETGDIMNRLHAHIWVTFDHYSQIQINPHVLAAEVKRRYNTHVGENKEHRISRQPYLHIKLLPQSNWTSIMKQYIHKGMTHEG